MGAGGNNTLNIDYISENDKIDIIKVAEGGADGLEVGAKIKFDNFENKYTMNNNLVLNGQEVQKVNNEGTIKGQLNFNANTKVQSFTNSGSIGGRMSLNNAKINHFHNTGTISNEIYLQNNTEIDHFQNDGKLNTRIALTFYNNVKLGTFEHNGDIATYIAFNGKNSKIDTFVNSGSINTMTAIGNLPTTEAEAIKIGEFTVTGTGKINEFSSYGLRINDFNINQGGKVTTLHNHANGNSDVSYIGNLNVDGEITTLHNRGEIDNIVVSGKVDNINNNDNAVGSANINKITIKAGGSATINNSNTRDVAGVASTIGGIKVEKGASAYVFNGENKAGAQGVQTNIIGGIENDGDLTFQSSSKGDTNGIIINNGNLSVTNKGNVTGIQNNGTITKIDNDAGIIKHVSNVGDINGDITNINNGIIGGLDNKGVINGNITNTGSLDKITNSGDIAGNINNNGSITQINNSGDIGGNISNSSKDNITINNTGKGNIGGGIINNGGAKITINNGTNATIGTTNGVSIKNNSGSVIFNGGITADNPLVLGGDTSKISAGKLEINGIKPNQTYSKDSFFIDENGNGVNAINKSTILSSQGGIFELNQKDDGIDVKLNSKNLIGEAAGEGAINSTKERSLSNAIAVNTISAEHLQIHTLKNISYNNQKYDEDGIIKEEYAKKLSRYAYLNNTANLKASELLEIDSITNSNKAKSNVYTYLMPTYIYTKEKLGDTGKAHGRAYSLTGGVQMVNNYGVVGAYGGYEIRDRKNRFSASSGRLEFDDNAYFGGFSYYNGFNLTNTYEPFVGLLTKYMYNSSDITKYYADNTGLVKGKAKTHAYEATAIAGLKIYTPDRDTVFAPSLGISYQKIINNPFEINHSNGNKEQYFKADNDFVDLTLSMQLQTMVTDNIEMDVSAGAIYSVHEDAKNSMAINGIKLDGEYQVDNWAAFGKVGVTYWLNNKTNVSLNYGLLANQRMQSHTGFLKVGYWW